MHDYRRKKFCDRHDICCYRAVAQDVGLAGCDTVLMREWFLTFQRNVEESRLCVSSKRREALTQQQSGQSHKT